ncbi:MAG: Hsp70 family protein, partial [Alphaproteobacteria bacterium]|nr:Hsp70 family protein [Alphaproteobacteria bacterium]
MLFDIQEPGGVQEAQPLVGLAIGIDLGTTHTVVSFVKDGNPQTILMDGHTPLMPSIIAHDQGQFIVGHGAKNYSDHLFSIKRHM